VAVNTSGRNDLTEQMLEDCYDCPEGINGKRVEFNTPLISIEPLDFGKLHANEYRSGAFSPFTHSLSPSSLVHFTFIWPKERTLRTLTECHQGTAKQGDRLLLLSGDSTVPNRGEAYR
jgi:hypothetical protein